ncbi:MAG: hypothetical protein OXN17_00380 [Candidatus Poribacteria bacterium]|nr:hypothetical protein [Candidatus Poribacteria bacterium]MDE0505466.1 hypothetical protein [Candidatus Poribacteria bacterium]
MNSDSQTTEIRNLVEHTHEMVIQIAKDQNQMRGELTQIIERLASLENRMTALETRIDARMTALETQMSDLETGMGVEIRDVFKWLICMMVPVWIGVIAALIIQFLKTG